MNPLRLLVLLVSLPLLLGGCGEKDGGVNAKKLEVREGIRYRKGSDAPYTGKVFNLYKSGKKESEANYKDGKSDGLVVVWHRNGQKVLELKYKDGKEVEGSYKYWNSKGEPVDSLKEAIEDY